MHKKVSIIEKKCTICKQIKPLEEFYKDHRTGDGYYTKCKTCHARLVKKWQTNNMSRFKEINSNWKKTHRSRRAQVQKEWAHANPERVAGTAKRTREKHPETSRNWRKKNKDKIRHYEQNRRARIQGNGGTLTVEEWNAILDFYGHKCLCCGRVDVKLTIDHVIPIFRGGKHCAENVQPLCGPCNSRKKDKVIDYRKEKYNASSRN